MILLVMIKIQDLYLIEPLSEFEFIESYFWNSFIYSELNITLFCR